MTPGNKKQAIETLSKLEADGQTNLWAGMFTGLELMKQKYESNSN